MQPTGGLAGEPAGSSWQVGRGDRMRGKEPEAWRGELGRGRVAVAAASSEGLDNVGNA